MKQIANHVYQIPGRNDYVIKIIADKNEYLEEVRVGSIPGIETVGVRVHSHGTLSKGNYYIIMDHVEMGQPDVTHMTAARYVSKFPEQKQSFLRALRKTLLRFYKLTGSFHGDLHFENVLVILSKKNRSLKQIKIIDYGNTVPIQKDYPLITYTDYARAIKKTFENIHSDVGEYPPGSRISVKYHDTNIPFRVNQNVIRFSVKKKWTLL